MAKLSTKIWNATNPLLKEGEEIKAVGQFYSGLHPLVSLTLVGVGAVGGAISAVDVAMGSEPVLYVFLIPFILIGGLIYALFTRNWFVSITNQRVIFIPLMFFGSSPQLSKTHSVPLNAVQVSENGISVQHQISKFPHVFRFWFGAKSKTGLDKRTFISALVSNESSSLTESS